MNKKKMIIIGSIAAAVVAAVVVTVVLFTTVFGGNNPDKDSSSQTNATSGKINVNVGSVEAEEESIVKVPVTVSNNPGFTAHLVNVTFDGKVIEYMGYEKGDVISDYEFVPGDNSVSILHSEAELKDTTNNGTMYTLKFRVIGKSGDKSDVKINVPSDGGFINLDEKDLEPIITNGAVTVK